MSRIRVVFLIFMNVTEKVKKFSKHLGKDHGSTSYFKIQEPWNMLEEIIPKDGTNLTVIINC